MCGPYEITGQWQNFLWTVRGVCGLLTLIMLLFVFVAPMPSEDEGSSVGRKLVSLVWVITFGILTYGAHVNIVGANLRCFGHP